MAYLSEVGKTNSIQTLSEERPNSNVPSNAITDCAVACLNKANPSQEPQGLNADRITSDHAIPSLIFMTPARTGVITPKTPLQSNEKNIDLTMEDEAKRQGYPYNDQLQMDINEDEDHCKTWDQLYKKLQLSGEEAKRQGYAYNDELKVYINKEGDCCKTRDQLYNDLQLRVEEEAKRQGLTYSDFIEMYVDEEGEICKTWDQLYKDLQPVTFMLPGEQPLEPYKEEISVKSSSRKAVKEEPQEQEISLKSGSRKAVKEASVQTNFNPEKEEIDFLTGHLLQFDLWVEGLTDAGWQFYKDVGIVYNSEGDNFPYNDEVERFSTLKKKFRTHLETHGFQYDEKTKTIYKGLMLATIAEVTEVVKAYLPDESEVKMTKGVLDSTQSDIFNLFAPQLQFDAYLTKMEDLRHKVDYEKRYVVINGVTRTFDQLQETAFLPMQKRFLSYIETQGYSYDFVTQVLSKGNEPATFWQAESLKTSFRHYYLHPDFEEVKAGLKPTMDYEDFIKVLKNKGYKYSADQESVLQGNWMIQRKKTLMKFKEYGFDYDLKTDRYEKNRQLYTLDQLYLSIKGVLLKMLEDNAEKVLQLKYDKPSGCFINETYKLTVEEVLHQFMIMDFGL